MTVKTEIENEDALKLVRVKKLADLWGTDVGTIYRQIKRGKLKAIRFPSGAIRIPLYEVRRFLAENVERSSW